MLRGAYVASSALSVRRLTREAPAPRPGTFAALRCRFEVMSGGPYRADDHAVEERLEAALAELAEIARHTQHLAALAARRSDLEREIEGLRARRRSPRSLALLERVTVAAPCNASWDDMVGDERQRFCGRCGKDVFDLSAMTRDEAEAFVRERVGACVRLYRRVDGTVMTADCPTGVRKRRRRRAALAAAGAGALAASAIAGGNRHVSMKVERAAVRAAEPLELDSRLTMLQGAMVLDESEEGPRSGPTKAQKRPRRASTRQSPQPSRPPSSKGAAAGPPSSPCACMAGDPLCACEPVDASPPREP